MAVRFVSVSWLLMTISSSYTIENVPLQHISSISPPSLLKSEQRLQQRTKLCSHSSSHRNEVTTSRRSLILGPTIAATTTLISPSLENHQIQSAHAAESSTPSSSSVPTNGLASRLAKRDPAELRKTVFNIPPAVQVYPPFMRGSWEVTCRFNGYLFPSKSVPRSDLISDSSIPGFQKCSIAALADVGLDQVRYKMAIDESTGQEDRIQDFKSSVDAHLGYEAVRDVIYDAVANPNRISVDFVPNRTRNANRIELFCNARESELVKNSEDERLSVFVCSESIRQVTFGLSQEFGVARQVVGNYAHFWTWRQERVEEDWTGRLKGNVLTAAYLDALDPLFFQEPSKPVAVYSHDLLATRV